MKTLKVAVRWLMLRDMDEILAIENDCFEYVWTLEDFLSVLRRKDAIGMVAEAQGEIVGFMIYQLFKDRLRILNFAVAPEVHRTGVGSQMAQRLKDKLSQQRRNHIVLDVRETNLQAQIFFRSQGFRAVGILRNWYEETLEDAIQMQYTINLTDDICNPLSWKNRISNF